MPPIVEADSFILPYTNFFYFFKYSPFSLRTALITFTFDFSLTSVASWSDLVSYSIRSLPRAKGLKYLMVCDLIFLC